MREDLMYRYYMPTEIHSAVDAMGILAEQVARFGKRPFLVTGKHAARRTGMLDQALSALPEAVLFEAVEENPSTTTCETGAAKCREAGCDCVVALGGGSPIDAAKAIALLSVNPGRCADYFGSTAPREPALPLLAIPTTAGTGSEATPYAVLVDVDGPRKRTLGAPDLFPRVALLDPRLSTTMPWEVTLATGLDALSQGMEGLLSRKATRLGNLLALETCRLVTQWLPIALREPKNLNARAAMLEAAMLSGCVIAQSGTTLVHGMGYYFTLEHHVPHGIANALLLGPVFQRNAQYAPAKVAQICDTLRHPVRNLNSDEVAAAILDALYALFTACDWQPNAAEYGITPEACKAYAAAIYEDSYRFKNQIGQFNLADVEAIFEAACTGEGLFITG